MVKKKVTKRSASKNSCEAQNKSIFYMSIISIIAIVAIVLLIINFTSSDDSMVVVDEEGNIAGEAFRIAPVANVPKTLVKSPTVQKIETKFPTASSMKFDVEDRLIVEADNVETLTGCKTSGWNDNTRYVLDRDITYQSQDGDVACFNINDAQNVILDCAGHIISAQDDTSDNSVYEDSLYVSTGRPAVLIDNSNEVAVRNCEFDGTDYSGFPEGNNAIMIKNSEGVLISRNTIDGFASSGVNLESTINSAIYYNTISNIGSRFYKEIDDKIIWLNSPGLIITSESSNNLVQQNTFTKNGVSLSLSGNNNQVKLNWLVCSQEDSIKTYAGAEITGDNNLFESNLIEECYYGLNVKEGASNNNLNKNKACLSHSKDVGVSANQVNNGFENIFGDKTEINSVNTNSISYSQDCPILSCEDTDSDAVNQKREKGIVTISDQDGNVYGIYEDYCSDSDTVVEYFCSEDSYSGSLIRNSYGLVRHLSINADRYYHCESGAIVSN